MLNQIIAYFLFNIRRFTHRKARKELLKALLDSISRNGVVNIKEVHTASLDWDEMTLFVYGRAQKVHTCEVSWVWGKGKHPKITLTINLSADLADHTKPEISRTEITPGLILETIQGIYTSGTRLRTTTPLSIHSVNNFLTKMVSFTDRN